MNTIRTGLPLVAATFVGTMLSVGDLQCYTKIVNKETSRDRSSKSLIHQIILKEASSKLFHEMVYNDKNNRMKRFISCYTSDRSKVNKVAKYLLIHPKI